ncbi:MAG TPA: hypothetical protein VM938_10685 [Acidimicrobiales bacterium]|nr:hypothetical protein [Acidimicrobiales bacterium]
MIRRISYREICRLAGAGAVGFLLGAVFFIVHQVTVDVAMGHHR